MRQTFDSVVIQFVTQIDEQSRPGFDRIVEVDQTQHVKLSPLKSATGVNTG
jgi:hypothetical protein